MPQPARYLITAALPYANGPLHIGQMAGAYLPADIYVRYLRSRGREVVFVCGSDEHGAAITLKARKEGKTPQEIVDEFHAINRDAFQGMDIHFDIYHRTSSALHHRTSSEFFRVLDEKGVFTVQESEQYYDQEYQQFLADRYIKGTCPRCGYDQAYGDQCERCGATLSPSDLIQPWSTLSGNPPVLKRTRHWYLPLDRYQDWARSWLLEGEGQTEPWKRNVIGQVRSWLDDGLQPRAMTRDLDWGVPVPRDDAKGKVLYVWLDAPVGYISATRQWALDKGRNWETWWKSPDTKLVHFIGKDNIVFHCIIFPVILHAHGGFILPTNVPANEFMNMEGAKLSTSRNWAVWIPEYIQEFPDRIDVLRYVLCANAPETKDSEFTWKDWQTRNNSELVANLGNFVNRVLTLTHNYCSGEVPAPDPGLVYRSPQQEAVDLLLDDVLREGLRRMADLAELLEAYRFRDGLKVVMEMASWGNGFLQANEPWKLNKTNPGQASAVLFAALQWVDMLSVVVEPFLPRTSASMRRMLNRPLVSHGSWSDLERLLHKAHAPLPPGHHLGATELLFEKIPDELVEAKLAQLEAIRRQNESGQPASGGSSAEVESAYEAIKPSVTYEDFAKLDLRVATILRAEAVPKTDKLLKLELDLGFERRTVVSGIAGSFSPDDLPGRKVLLLANLEPRKMRGIESQGMILMASGPEGALFFVSPDDAAPDGASVR